MRRNLLLAGVLAVVLANALVFGALSTSVGKPTPRPTRAVVVKTFTPNPELARRRVTPTATHTATPTRIPTSAFPTETLAPRDERTE
jgi:hypothetical protein